MLFTYFEGKGFFLFTLIPPGLLALAQPPPFLRNSLRDFPAVLLTCLSKMLTEITAFLRVLMQ